MTSARRPEGAAFRNGEAHECSSVELAAALQPLVGLVRSGRLDAHGLADALLGVTAASAPVDTPTELVDARTVARAIGARPEWVRAHAEELGAVRLGDGPRGRLRFDLAVVREALRGDVLPDPQTVTGRPRPDAASPSARPATPRIGTSASSGAALLPIRPSEAR